MRIMIHLESHPLSQSIGRYLVSNGYDNVVVKGKTSFKEFSPEVLLVDIDTLTNDLLAEYPGAKVLLIDGAIIEPERLFEALLSYRTHGMLCLSAGLVEVRIDNGAVRLIANSGNSSNTQNETHNNSGKGCALE